jgi:hypothetical protein
VWVFGPRRYGLSGGSKALKSSALRVHSLNGGGTTRAGTAREQSGLERGPAAPERSKPLKAKPQERYRDETSPDRCGGVEAVESVRNAEDGRWRAGKPA